MIELAFIIAMGGIARLAGMGWGKKAPEWLHSAAYGGALGCALYFLGFATWLCGATAAIGTLVSYAGMQSATWMFLRWETHADPNTGRTSTLKGIIDKIAALFGYSLGQEGYAWVAAMVKGFIIGLPVGGFLTAIAWACGYEAGSHAKGRVEKYGIDPHGVSEFLSGAFGAASIVVFLNVIKVIAQ